MSEQTHAATPADAPEAPQYVYATPGRVMSTLAYRLLSRDNWPVYVDTSRNYTAHGTVQPPADPGDTIYGSAHLREVDHWHPLSGNPAPNPDGWQNGASYLDDRIYPETEHAYTGQGADPAEVCGPWDEYYIHVETPDGGNIATYGDYSGDTVTRSNHRSLLRDFPDVFVEGRYSHGGRELFIPLFVPAEDPSDPSFEYSYPDGVSAAHYHREAADYLASQLEALMDYPLYDEQDHAELETELAYEAVDDQWTRGEIRDGVAELLAERLMARVGGAPTVELVELLGQILDDSSTILGWDGATDETGRGYYTLRMLYLGYQEENGNITYEGSSVVFCNSEAAYKAIAEHLLP
jgi:hypothetical protein